VGSRWVESQLFGVSAVDPTTYLAVVIGVAFAARLATWHDAHQAARRAD
jgi:hypothetical protein